MLTLVQTDVVVIAVVSVQVVAPVRVVTLDCAEARLAAPMARRGEGRIAKEGEKGRY